MKFTKENSGYICHRCFYISFTKSDMIKHCNKKNLCKTRYNCLFSDKEYKDLSIKKRYYFTEKNIDITKDIFLSTTKLIKLVTEFNDEINIIQDISSLYNEEIIENDEISIIDNKNNTIDYITFIDGIKHFMCPKCKTVYKKKETLEKHLENPQLCYKKEKFNKLLNNVNNPNQINIQNLNNNIQNIQNNQNIQNVNNNLAQNNYNFELKDFIENNYSHSHIPRNAIQNKDFYLHKNFLNLIMENDENKNIYFDGKYAFVYTDGGLKRIQSDKAGYLVLEKLDKAIISYIYSNPQSLKEDFSYVDRYYSVMKNKYIFDTIHKPYNLDTKKFDYCETKNIRTRDKCLSEITQICNLHKDKTKEIMKSKEYDKFEIDANYQVNIPNYESARTRNKGFIDNGKYW